MVRVVQLVERQIVVLVVVGSSPTSHPKKDSGRHLPALSFLGRDAAFGGRTFTLPHPQTPALGAVA